MARKNRIVVEDGTYHLVSRIAHREFLLADPLLKDLVVDWMYGIADFCGIEVLAWNILDNHFHIEVEMPQVPKEYWTDPDHAPEVAAFSLRPPECHAPRWTPDLADIARLRAAGVPLAITPDGDEPSESAVVASLSNGVPLVSLPRPETGFVLSDDEMLFRLGRLSFNHSDRAARTARRWVRLRTEGRHDVVEAEKDALCRRMYNISLFMKELKQRVSEYFNRRLGHSGQLWEGRFYSGLVEDDRLARIFTTAYIDWNAPKAGLAEDPSGWRWCSYSVACGDGPYAERARKGYEKALGCPWEEARRILESIFMAKLPETYDPKADQTHYTVVDPDGKERKVALTLAQLIKSEAKRLFRGGFFGRNIAFVKETARKLPKKFPLPHGREVEFLSRCDWSLPMVA